MHMKQGLPSIPKEKNALLQALGRDQEKFKKIYEPLNKKIDEALSKKSYVEAFLLSWTFIEQILLPSLIRQICHRLDFKTVPSFDERTPVNTLITLYYFLSHDLELYQSLVECNKQRRNVVHRLENESDVASINEKAKTATKLVISKINVQLIERLSGHVAVPVLALYAKGWNDCRAEVVRRGKEYLAKM